MSAPRTSVKVSIAGQELTIRSDASPDHTREVAAYLDKAIRDLMNSGVVVESSRAAILAALQITDELFRERNKQRATENAMRSLSAEVRRWLPPAKRTVGGD